MKRLILTAAAAVLCTAPALAQSADAGLTAQVQQADDNQCALLVAGRLDLYAATMTGDFVDTTPKGEKITKTTVMNHAREMQAFLKLDKCTARVSDASRSGDAIAATIRQELSGTVLIKGDWHQIRIVGVSTDTYVEHGNALLESASVDNWGETFVDGKLVQKDGTVPASEESATSS